MLYWDTLLTPKRRRERSSVAKATSDFRSPFKKDFDTICNSTILRRLQDKAQVFPLEEEDYARSRLTHSIEVLSIAQSLGIEIKKIIKKAEYRQYINPRKPKVISNQTNIRINDIPIILMAAAFLHDMGNPPFGHLGEQIINDWFRNNLENYEYLPNEKKIVSCDQSRASLKNILNDTIISDLEHFDGNAQLLRLVTRLNYFTDDKGMNLTYPVMATFIKYPCSSENVDSDMLSKHKAGFFSTEADIFEDIENSLGLKQTDHYCRHPLAFLLEAADDIAYLTADVEDANHKGILSLAEIEKTLFESDKQDEDTEEHIPPPSDPMILDVLDAINSYKQAAKDNGYPDQEDYVMHRLRVYIKGQMINAMADAFERLYPQIMEGNCEQELIEVSSACKLACCLKKLEKKHIHYCKDIVNNKTRAISVINKLLDTYVPAVVNYSKENDNNKDTEPNLLYMSLSVNYRFVCEQANLQTDLSYIDILYNKLRLVIDQISGMTDSRALSVYHTITAK